MGQHYAHLTIGERRQLFIMHHHEKRTARTIAKQLGRSPSTVSREIQRHMSTTYLPCYYPNLAEHDYRMMTRRRGQRLRLKSTQTRAYVTEKIRLGWSPEIIAGRLRADGAAPYVCHEAIYQFIYKESPHLSADLPRKHKKRRIKRPYRSTPQFILDRTNIAKRSPAANERREYGHWESDSLLSAGHKPGCNVIVERVTRLTRITKLSHQTSAETKSALLNALAPFPTDFVKSITYDNGSENAQHLAVNEALRCQSFFCAPYHSWEKGSVEQMNGLFRRYFPKHTDFAHVPTGELDRAAELLNTRPRKCLGYRTPNEAYDIYVRSQGTSLPYPDPAACRAPPEAETPVHIR